MEGLQTGRQRINQPLNQRQSLAASACRRTGLGGGQGTSRQVEHGRHGVKHAGRPVTAARTAGSGAHRRRHGGLGQDGTRRAPRPVQNPADQKPSSPAAAAPEPGWPEGADDLAERLLHKLAIGDREWHGVKNQPSRRAAEQIAAALALLLSSDDPRRRAIGEGRQQAIDLLENSLGWLKGSLRDPGCPSRMR